MSELRDKGARRVRGRPAPGSLCVLGPDEVWSAPMLREYFRQHNREVLILVGLAAVASAGLWFLTYGLFFWLATFFATVRDGVNASRPELVPVWFIYGAGGLVLLAWVTRHLFPESGGEDKKWAANVLDLVLAIPRASFAVWSNLSAWQHWSEAEMERGAELLNVLRRHRGYPLTALAQEISNKRTRRKIVFGLQLVQLVRVGRKGGVITLSLGPRAHGGENLGQIVPPQ